VASPKVLIKIKQELEETSNEHIKTLKTLQSTSDEVLVSKRDAFDVVGAKVNIGGKIRNALDENRRKLQTQRQQRRRIPDNMLTYSFM